MQRLSPASVGQIVLTTALAALAANCGVATLEVRETRCLEPEDGIPPGCDPDAPKAPAAPQVPDAPVVTARFSAVQTHHGAAYDIVFDAGESETSGDAIDSYAWDFGDGTDGVGATTEHTYDGAGCYEVTLRVVSDGSESSPTTQTVVVTTGQASPSETPVTQIDQSPVNRQLLPRDLVNDHAVVSIRGAVQTPGYNAVVADLLRDGVVTATAQTLLCSKGEPDPFELRLSLPAEKVNHTVELYVLTGTTRVLVHSVHELVAGDAFIIQGQSNAVARQYSGDANGNQGPFVRSFGTLSSDAGDTVADVSWHLADGNRGGGAGAIGQWGLRMGRLLSDASGVPVAIVNGAHGGKRIGFFQRNDADPANPSTNYGRLLTRIRAAGLASGIRAILFYQGESDGGGATVHRDGFTSLHSDWLEDYPTVEQIHVTQVRPGCGSPSPELREVQRKFEDELDRVRVMSTTGLNGHDNCHYAYDQGYERLGTRYAAMLTRDLYGGLDQPSIDPPNPRGAVFSNADATEITLTMRRADATLQWSDGAQADFVIEGSQARVSAGVALGNTLILTLDRDGSGASGISYVGSQGSGDWVTNSGGVGLLNFHALPIQ